MTWAGTTIATYGLPVEGHRVGMRWIEDESVYWTFDEDLYATLT